MLVPAGGNPLSTALNPASAANLYRSKKGFSVNMNDKLAQNFGMLVVLELTNFLGMNGAEFKKFLERIENLGICIPHENDIKWL